MTTKPNMMTARATAGARYANAMVEMRAAYVDLAAIETALQNRNVGVGTSETQGGIGVSQTFNGRMLEIPLEARHPVFAPDALAGIDNAVDLQTKTYLATLQAG